MAPCFKIEKDYPEPLAGVDEAGCAPLAGPVVAAAVVLDRRSFPRGIDDSKALPAPARESLYARLQKSCADAVVSKSTSVARLRGYVNAIASWVEEYPQDARFLTQFFALLPVDRRYRELHERNLRIGRERIVALLQAIQKEGRLRKAGEHELEARAASLQHQVFGYIVIQAGGDSPGPSTRAREELLRCCLEGVGL